MRVVKIRRFTEEQESVEWIIESLLPDVGWTLFYGTRGLGKTTFAMQMCAALQNGTDFLGLKVKQRDILYIQADSLTDEWRMMLKRIAPKSDGWTLVDVPAKCLGNPEYVAQLASLTEKVQPGYIVFDSLYNLTAWPINTEQVSLPINMMKGIAGVIPWMLIHHPPHEQSRAAGHHSLGANCSNEWSLLKRELKIEKGRLVKVDKIPLERDEQGLWVMRDGSGGDDGKLKGRSIL